MWCTLSPLRAVFRRKSALSDRSDQSDQSDQSDRDSDNNACNSTDSVTSECSFVDGDVVLHIGEPIAHGWCDVMREK